MLRIGGDLPVHRRARARQPVLGLRHQLAVQQHLDAGQADAVLERPARHLRSEEHTSELQSLMRISYAVFCLKKKKTYNSYARRSKTSSNNSQTASHDQ